MNKTLMKILITLIGGVFVFVIVVLPLLGKQYVNVAISFMFAVFFGFLTVLTIFRQPWKLDKSGKMSGEKADIKTRIIFSMMAFSVTIFCLLNSLYLLGFISLSKLFLFLLVSMFSLGFTIIIIDRFARALLTWRRKPQKIRFKRHISALDFVFPIIAASMFVLLRELFRIIPLDLLPPEIQFIFRVFIPAIFFIVLLFTIADFFTLEPHVMRADQDC